MTWEFQKEKDISVSGEGNGTPLQYSCLENPMDGGAWWAAVHGVAKSQTRLRDFTFTFHFHALEEEMATHSSVLAWRIPGTGEPGGLPSMGSHRVRHNWSNLAAAATSLLYSCWHLLIVFFILFESFLVIGMNSNFQLNSGQSPLFFSETPDLLQIFFPQTPLQKKERRGTTTLLPSRSRNSDSHTPSQARYVCVCVLWGWLLVTGGQGWELGDMSCLHWYHSRYELIISELLWNF